MKLSVITPVYNEEEGISLFHARTRAVLDTLADEVEAEILFVVDRCHDGTLDILRNILARDPYSRILVLSSRFGHQASLMAGIAYSREADAIIMMDSDLQHPPELIPTLLEKFREGFDVVYTVRSDNESTGFLRSKSGELFYALLNKLSSVEIRANTADFRLISRRVADILADNVGERNLFFRGLIPWLGFSQLGVEYKAASRLKGTSKYSLKQMLQLALAGILAFSTKPLHLGIFLGLMFSGASILYALVLIANYFISQSLPSGWTSISVLILLAAGIQLGVVGIIGLYIGGIYEEVKDRPRYIVQEHVHQENVLLHNQ